MNNQELLDFINDEINKYSKEISGYQWFDARNLGRIEAFRIIKEKIGYVIEEDAE